MKALIVVQCAMNVFKSLQTSYTYITTNTAVLLNTRIKKGFLTYQLFDVGVSYGRKTFQLQLLQSAVLKLIYQLLKKKKKKRLNETFPSVHDCMIQCY